MTPTPLTPTQLQRLARLHDRQTLYEVAAIKGDRKVLIAYAGRTSRRHMWDILFERAERISKALDIPADQMFATPGKRSADGFTLAGWTIRATGRTERDAIMAGELERMA